VKALNFYMVVLTSTDLRHAKVVQMVCGALWNLSVRSVAVEKLLISLGIVPLLVDVIRAETTAWPAPTR
jgi:hypothetical protein